MPRYVAFLRAINVGGHTVRMERLRELFAELGFARVETFIASGNVIFDDAGGETGAMERRIERRLAEALGYEVATFVRGVAEVAAVADAAVTADAATVYVGFLARPPDERARARIEALSTAGDALHVHGRELYWRCDKRFSDSPLSGGVLEKALGMPMTMRNATTVRKLAAKYGAA